MIKFVAKFFSGIAPRYEKALGIEYVQSIEEYLTALEGIQEGNWGLVEYKLSQCLEVLEKRGLFAEPPYNLVLKRFAFVQRIQNKKQVSERLLENIITNYLDKLPRYQAELSSSYETLLMQYIDSNLDKAIELAKQLLAKNDEFINLEFVKNILAIAYMLKGDELWEAKKILAGLITTNSDQPQLFHNLGCAQWWHLSSFIKPKDSNEENPEYKSAVMEFTDSILNHNKAIQLIEGLTAPYDPNPLNPKLKDVISGLSLTNIAEIHFQTGNLEESLKWLRTALTLYDQIDKSSIGRALVLTGLLQRRQQDANRAETTFRNAITILEGRGDSNEVLVYQVLANLLSKQKGKEAEVDELLRKANQIQKSLAYWSERAIHLHIPMWTI